MKPIKIKDLEDPFSRKNMKEFNKVWKKTLDALVLEWIKEWEAEKAAKKKRRKKAKNKLGNGCPICGSKIHTESFHYERCPNGYR